MQRRCFLKSISTISTCKNIPQASYWVYVTRKSMSKPFIQAYVQILFHFQRNQWNFSENLVPEGDYCLYEQDRECIFLLETLWKSKTSKITENITEKSPGREYHFLVLPKATEKRILFCVTLTFGNQELSSIWSWFPYHLLESLMV